MNHSSAGAAGLAAAGAPAAGAPSTVGGAGSSAGGAPAAAGAPGVSGATSGGAPAGGAPAGGATSGGMGGASGGSSAGSGGMSGAVGMAGAGGMSTSNAKESLIWLWGNYKNALAAVVANSKSFTHVSLALYDINYAYASGAPKLGGGNDSFDGMTSKQMITMVHGAGLKAIALMYAGSGNNGTDQGIQNILNDTNGAQKNFIDATIAEAMDKGWDGWNLDWEPGGTGYSQYGVKLITFFKAYTAAAHLHNLEISLDGAGFYTRQCGDNGLVDLAAVGNSIDQIIMEDYAGSLGGAIKSCPATNPATDNCNTYLGQLDAMCNLPRAVANIGLISPFENNPSTNPFAPDALNALDAYGFTRVSLWPDDNGIVNDTGIPNGGTWYKLLAAWLAKK
jgi:hypothetical protein